jgi:DNA-binding response OmpR family regulator
MARVLVVDDDAPIRGLVRHACSLDGHEVREAFDTATGVAAYLAFDPDLLVLDLQMPGGGGAAVLGQLRAARPMGLGKVLVLSGYLDQMSKTDVLALRADATLQKPVTVPALLATVRGLLLP